MRRAHGGSTLSTGRFVRSSVVRTFAVTFIVVLVLGFAFLMSSVVLGISDAAFRLDRESEAVTIDALMSKASSHYGQPLTVQGEVFDVRSAGPSRPFSMTHVLTLWTGDLAHQPLRVYTELDNEPIETGDIVYVAGTGVDDPYAPGTLATTGVVTEIPIAKPRADSMIESILAFGILVASLFAIADAYWQADPF